MNPRTYTPEEREKNRARALKWYYANKEAHKANTKRWNEANPEKVAARRLRTLARRRERLAGRPMPDVCDVCQHPPDSGMGKKLQFDHCHANGHFRGWLCLQCNSALGMTQDDPGVLRKLAEYIERDRKKRSG